MGELLQFFVSFEIKEEYGTNVENKIQIASGVIGDKAKYKFRVSYNATTRYYTIVNINNISYWKQKNAKHVSFTIDITAFDIPFKICDR